MQVITHVAEMHRRRRALAGSIGFVPTMGALHEGHLSLVRRCRQDNDWALVSIFVNPAQFGPQEDYAAYPRDAERDLALLQAERVDAVFMPPVEEVYPLGFATWLEVSGVSEPLEGAHRPGHCRGVATVVAKLFNITRPTRAYFGQKDAQQALVIQRLVTDLDLDLEVVVLPTVREPDGLAMSSRNAYLSPAERQAATVLYRALQQAQALWQGGERSAEKLRGAMRDLMAAEPLARTDYCSVADARTLQEFQEVVPPALCCVAVRIGHTRLIDNITLL